MSTNNQFHSKSVMQTAQRLSTESKFKKFFLEKYYMFEHFETLHVEKKTSIELMKRSTSTDESIRDSLLMII